MEFVYADQLRSAYHSQGQFYQLKAGSHFLSCRRVVELLRHGEIADLAETPDAVVVMMNPGSSKPKNSDVPLAKLTHTALFRGDWSARWQEIRADNAQYQLMRLMHLRNWRRLRVINLCDLREGNSQRLALRLNSLSTGTAKALSLGSKSRRAELEMLIAGAPTIIFAWGSLNCLKQQAANVQAAIPYGIGLALSQPWFRFASPYRKDQKLQWLRDIDDLIELSQKSTKIIS